MFPVEFDGPAKNMDTIEIQRLPAGYEVDDLLRRWMWTYSFASYHSQDGSCREPCCAIRGPFEIKELSVPLNKWMTSRSFYRIIAGDERNTAVLKPAAH